MLKMNLNKAKNNLHTKKKRFYQNITRKDKPGRGAIPEVHMKRVVLWFFCQGETPWNRLWGHCIQNSPCCDFHSLPFSFFDHISYHCASHTDFLLVPSKFHIDYFKIFVLSGPSFHQKFSLFSLLKVCLCY